MTARWTASAFIFTLAITAHGQTRAAPECTFDSVTGGCQVLKDQMSTQQIWLSDGTTFRNPEYDNSFWSWVWTMHYSPPSITTQRKTRIAELVEMARQSILTRILRGRAPESLSPAERSQYDRVRTVTYDFNQSFNDDSFFCAQAAPNAGYSQRDHSIKICRAAMVLPDASLVEVIAHELGHSISPCLMGGDLMQTNERPPPLPFNAEGGPIQNVGAGRYQAAEPDFSALIAAGKATRLAARVEPADFPQKTQMDCYIELGLGSRIPEERMDAAADYLFGELSKNSPEAAVTREGLEAGMRRHPMCWTEKSANNQIGETMPDMWGAAALADYWKANPPRTELDKISGFAILLGELCGPGADEDIDDTEEHPEGRKRADLVFMNNPGIQQALGCTPKGASCDSDPHGRWRTSPASWAPASPAATTR